MSRRVLARPLAAATLASALVLTAPVAALAGGQGNGQGNGQGKAGTSQADSSAGKANGTANGTANGKAKGKSKDKSKAKTKGKAQGTSGNADADAGQPNGKAKGQSEAKAKGKSSGKGKGKGKSQDPAGNNGTVKIAPYGEMDRIPNNTPHPGCTFQVEWYGFDEGDDVVSQVAFAMHAPTTDVGLSVDGPAEVFVGGDSATGAGTETGLDGRETYTLSFDGEPHPKQGYHVKLTVATPHSKGNDTKTKVFWVEECDTAGTADEDSTTGDSGTDGGSESDESGVAGTSQDADDNGTDREDGPDSGVLGTSLSVDSSSDADAAATGADGPTVPTGVDAGAEGSALERAGDLARSPWALLVLALGLAAGAAAVVTRRAGR